MDKWIYGALLMGAFVAILTISVVIMLMPGHYVYVPEATPVPKATPIDVILRMRDADGKNEQTWVCKFEAQAGWVCQPGEEPHGETLDE